MATTLKFTTAGTGREIVMSSDFPNVLFIEGKHPDTVLITGITDGIETEYDEDAGFVVNGTINDILSEIDPE